MVCVCVIDAQASSAHIRTSSAIASRYMHRSHTHTYAIINYNYTRHDTQHSRVCIHFSLYMRNYDDKTRVISFDSEMESINWRHTQHTTLANAYSLVHYLVHFAHNRSCPVCTDTSFLGPSVYKLCIIYYMCCCDVYIIAMGNRTIGQPAAQYQIRCDTCDTCDIVHQPNCVDCRVTVCVW